MGPARRPVLVRLWERVRVGGEDECWPWLGAASSGYGYIRVGGRDGAKVGAHVVAYESVHGPIPLGHEVDHLCENKRCCNPAHLEAVTHQDNMLRFHGQRTTCLHGHPLDGVRRDGRRKKRYCKTCTRARNAKA